MREAAEQVDIRLAKIIMAVCATTSEGKTLSKTGIGASTEAMVLTSTCVDLWCVVCGPLVDLLNTGRKK